MKTFKVVLGILAFTGAIGGALATQYQEVDPIRAYQFIDGTQDLCIEVTDHNCVVSGKEMCQLDNQEGDILRATLGSRLSISLSSLAPENIRGTLLKQASPSAS